jgi:hypothetical protein
MAKRERRRRNRYRAPAPAHSQRGGADDHDEPDVAEEVHELLSDPLEFLLWVSSVMAGDEESELEELVDALARNTCFAMWSVLSTIGELTNDGALRSHCRKMLERPHSPLPDWIARLDQTAVYGALESRHECSPRDDIIVGLRLVTGYEFAIVVVVDRVSDEVVNLLAVRAPLVDVPQKARAATCGGTPETCEVTLSYARRRIERAIASTSSDLPFVLPWWALRLIDQAEGKATARDPSVLSAEWYAAMLQLYGRQVGGTDALHALDTEPLPDEQFRWDCIPDDIRPRVTAVLDLCDACAESLNSAEYRTAFRRFLATAARGDPSTFRRRPRAAPTAAAVCWIVGKANRLFSWPGGEGLPVNALMTFLGLRADASASQRAATLLRAAGFDDCTRGWISLHSPRYLVSRTRILLVQDRDRWLAALGAFGAKAEDGQDVG